MSTPLRNRRPLLVAVGVGEIAIGCVVLFMAAMTLAEAAASARFPSVGVPSSLIRTGLGLLTLATLCLTIGVGSVRCSNWTRILAMVLCAAWVGLTATLDVFVIAHILRHGLAPSTAPASSFLDDALAAFVWALPAVFFLLLLATQRQSHLPGLLINAPLLKPTVRGRQFFFAVMPRPST